MLYKIKHIVLLLVVLFLMLGCWDDNVKSNLSDKKSYKGYVIDSPVVNLSYRCGYKMSKTQEGGFFECPTMPVTFFIDKVVLGTIHSINDDSNVYIQDILATRRSVFSDSEVLKLSALLQSLDDDGNISKEIKIDENFTLDTNKSLKELSFSEIKVLLKNKNKVLVSIADAEQHLREFSPIDTLKPVITLIGDKNLTIFLNSSFTDKGAKVEDDRDKTIKVISKGTVDINKIGLYTIKYNATDISGNKADEVTRVVNVIPVVTPLAKPSIENSKKTIFTKGSNATSVQFKNSGGIIASCSVTPSLPSGLILENNCTIHGKPTAVLADRTYTVIATNGSGSDTATVILSVIDNALSFIPKDELFPDQWYIDNNGVAPSSWGKFKNLKKGADLNVLGAWKQNVTGKGVVVTIADNGVDFENSDLKNKEEGSTSIQKLETPAIDKNDHGTACAGIIAALADTKGVVGIAPDSTLISHQILGGYDIGEQSTFNKILEDNVSTVSNHSYGEDDNGMLYPLDSFDYDDIKRLVLFSNNGKGHVALTASGNGRAYIPKDYKPSEIDPEYAELDKDEKVAKTFGDYAGLDIMQNNPYLLSISGFDANDKEVTYAEAGPSVLVAGATGDTEPILIFTVKIKDNTPVDGTIPVLNPNKKPAPSIATTGRVNISYSSNESFRDDGEDEPAGYNMAFNGTSAACPTVTGVVALIRSANPSLTWRDVRWILAKTARKIQSNVNIINQATGKPSTGKFAKPIWSKTGNSTFGKYSHYLGFGAVDATEAVKLAKSSTYKLLPPMKTCSVKVIDNKATIPDLGCPNTIEFVQVKLTAKRGLKINSSELTMQKGEAVGKVSHLFAKTTCTAKKGCDIKADTTVRTGTIVFMGDALSKGDTFSFSHKNSLSKTNMIEVKEIKIFGYDKTTQEKK